MTSRIDKDLKVELRQTAFDMWMGCHSQDEIVEAIGFSKQAVSEFFISLQKSINGTGAKNGQSSENPALTSELEREFDDDEAEAVGYSEKAIREFLDLLRNGENGADAENPVLSENPALTSELEREFTKSERAAIGQAIEAELGSRRGQRTDLDELSKNFNEVVPGKRTDQIAAEKAGFGNHVTYRQAKTVATQGTPELVEAMDQEAIAVSTAAKLVKPPLSSASGSVCSVPSRHSSRFADADLLCGSRGRRP